MIISDLSCFEAAAEAHIVVGGTDEKGNGNPKKYKKVNVIKDVKVKQEAYGGDVSVGKIIIKKSEHVSVSLSGGDASNSLTVTQS